MKQFIAQTVTVGISGGVVLAWLYYVAGKRSDIFRCRQSAILLMTVVLAMYSFLSFLGIYGVAQLFPSKEPRIEYRYPPWLDVPPESRSLTDLRPVVVMPDGRTIFIEKAPNDDF